MPTSDSSAPPTRSQKKHWVLRIIIALGALILLVAAVVQIVLWTNLPRSIVVSQIEKQLGLRLSVESLTTGWLGHTQLNRVTIALPLADKALLEVPVMKVKNTSIFGLIFGQSVEVQSIELDQPHLFVQQDSAGQWNLQQVAELLAQAGGKKSGEQSAATSSTPTMPKVHLVDGTVTIVDNQRKSVEISPVSVDGYADTGVSWKYDVNVPSHLAISGKLVPGGDWAHVVTMQIQDIAAWINPWDADAPAVQADVKWSGALSDAGIGGRLEIHKIVVAKNGSTAEAIGALTAAQSADGFSIRPDNLSLRTTATPLPELKLASGAITFAPATHDLKIEQLLIGLFGGSAKLNGGYNLNTGAAQLNAEWEKLALTKEITHSGGLAISLRKPFPDKITVDGHLTSAGWRGPGGWLASMNFNATGKSFSDLDWTVNADKLQWERHVQGLNLDGLALSGSLRDQTISLVSISLPQKELISGTASYQLSGKHSWEAHFQGEHWPFHLIPKTELGFELAVGGDNQHIALEKLLIKSPDVAVKLDGTYTFGTNNPVDLKVTIHNAAPAQAPAAVASSIPAKLLNGTIDGSFRLTGTYDPLYLEVAGTLDGREIDIRGHHLGDIQLSLAKQSRIDGAGLFIYTEELALLGGQWNIDGIYVPDWNDLTVDLAMKGASIRQIGTIFDQRDVDGTVDGKIAISVPGFNFDPKNIGIAPAAFVLHDLKVPGAEIDQIDATLALDHGKLTIDPIHLRRAEGAGDLRLAMDLASPRQIEARAKLTNWRIEVPGAEAHLNASIDIPEIIAQLPNAAAVDPARRPFGIRAPRVSLDATASLRDEKLGELVAYAGIDGRALDVRAVHMQLLGGRMDGQAYADMDHPERATAEFTWQNIEIEKIALLIPQLKDFHGKFTGDLRLQPPTTPHPRGPMAVVLTSIFDGGAWRTLPIKDLRIAGYFGPNPDIPEAGWRIVLEDSSAAPSYLHLAGGTLELWGRVGFHGRASTSQMILSFRDLNLNQIVHAIDPTASEMKARVAGNITVLRAPTPPTALQDDPNIRMFPAAPALVVTPVRGTGLGQPALKQLLYPIYGEGHIELSRANLLNFGPFAFVYDAAHLFRNHKSADGDGNSDFHLERGTIRLERLRYFNQGTEIRTVATISDLWKGSESRVIGSVALTARPLAGTKLPLFSNLDTALTSIQNTLPITAARIDGTLHKPKPQPLGVRELSQQMREFLVGDTHAKD